MKSISMSLLTFFLACSYAGEPQFNNFWYDGNAEISTYRISEMRYGEPREGVRIMVFVTEPLRLGTLIKPDSELQHHEQINVMKLNDIRRFNTGIYDYAVMTSTFSAVESQAAPPLNGTVKISFTEQDWCGTVFERLVRTSTTYEGTIHSYFETEGDQQYSFPLHNSLETEENLWIRIRELNGQWLKSGSSTPIIVLESMWSRRKKHQPVQERTGILTKGKPVTITTILGEMKAIPFTWKIGNEETTVWVEKVWPRRILSWKEPDGSTGEITASRREPYWKQHDNRDLFLRDSLRLSREVR